MQADTASSSQPRASYHGVSGSIAVIFLISIAVKLVLLPSYRSTDFEVHRNWLSITYQLPPSQWYHESTSQWTLDYPPLFAYMEYFFSHIAALVDPYLVEISATPISTTRVVLFQRLSVILSDCLLFYAVLQFSTSQPGKSRRAYVKAKKNITTMLVVLDAGLLMVDHIHFQYNGVLLGLLLLSTARIQQGKDVQAAFFYSVLLMMKHIYLYAAPLYFVYLFRHHCYVTYTTEAMITALKKGNASFSIVRFIRLGVLVLSVFCLSFVPVLMHHPSPFDGLKQIASRLFPVQRGLCHAYWAPNIWALYAFADKLLVLAGVPAKPGVAFMSGGLVQEASFAVLPDVPPLFCLLLTLILMLPVLILLWQKPEPKSFTTALAYCMLSSFMAGYHVHEKAILQVILPLAVTAADSVVDMRIYRLASATAYFSLFPLLFTPAEHMTKVLLTSMHILLSYTTLVPFLSRQQKAETVRLYDIETLYLTGLALTAIAASVFPYTPYGTKLPFLPLILYSVASAIGNVYILCLLLRHCFRKTK